MFEQHYLENKKPTVLACNSEKVYEAILESSKNNDLFQNAKPTLTRFLEFLEISLTWFLHDCKCNA